jgi:putative oxidoreductase
MGFSLLVVRSVVGALMIGHGTQKLYGWLGGGGPEGTAKFFSMLGYPKPKQKAMIAGAAEALSGALFILGLATPLAAAMLIGVMLNAMYSAHAGKGPWITNGGWEYTLVLSTISFMLAWMGPGAYSMDRVIGWYPDGAFAGLSALALGILTGIVILSTRRAVLDEREQQEEASHRRAA